MLLKKIHLPRSHTLNDSHVAHPHEGVFNILAVL